MLSLWFYKTIEVNFKYFFKVAAYNFVYLVHTFMFSRLFWLFGGGVSALHCVFVGDLGGNATTSIVFAPLFHYNPLWSKHFICLAEELETVAFPSCHGLGQINSMLAMVWIFMLQCVGKYCKSVLLILIFCFLTRM